MIPRKTMMCLPLTLPLTLIAVGSAAAQDHFRMDTQVYVGSQKEPVLELLTLFANGVVYDFQLSGTKEITVFHADQKRFVLLDSQRRVQTEITTKEIQDVILEIRDRIAGGNTEALFYPDFKVEYDQEDDRLQFTHSAFEYRVQGTSPKFPSATTRYQEFADWCAYLNALRPGAMPPFARVKVNATVAEKGLIPVEVERSILQGPKSAVRTVHQSNWRLSQRDEKKIELVAKYMADFKKVTPGEYFRPMR